MSNVFADPRLIAALTTGLKKINFTTPTPVQKQVIPAMLSHQTVVVQAATGSGKTHAYLLPLFNQIVAETPVVQAIVTAPSRELADQLYQVAKELRDACGLDIQIAHLAGGTDRERQVTQLTHRNPQLVIATPGRLTDLVKKKILTVDQVKTFVIDEADMTLDMGFLADVETVMAKLPKDVQVAAFSATIPVKLRHFLHKYLTRPEAIVVDNPTVIAPTIKNDLLDVGAKNRKHVIYQLLTLGQPYLAMVFANTKQTVDELTKYLQDQGLKVTKIHGDIPARERKRVLRRIEAGQYQYVVATDLAARGLDIDGVSLVINAEIPRDLEFVVHRIGRTGRNGLSGHAITLIHEEELNRIAELEHIGIKFDFVELRSGVLQPRKNHHAREQRRAKNDRLDPKLLGFVKKEKRQRKPGYKKKIQAAIKDDAAKKRKLQTRHDLRVKRRHRQQRNQSER